jgi:hypothetical protein
MQVVLYGSSLFIEGLDESLKAVPRLGVVRLRTGANNLLQQARRVQPDAVVAEAGALPDEFSIGFLKEFPGLLLVTLDRESSHLLVLSGQQAHAATTKDLVQVIETWRDSSPQPARQQAHLDRLWQFVTTLVAALRASPRRQKLTLALASISVCAVLAMSLAVASPQADAPLTGTAFGTFAPEVGLAFAGGMLLGALLLAVAMGRARHRIHWNIRDKK